MALTYAESSDLPQPRNNFLVLCKFRRGITFGGAQLLALLRDWYFIAEQPAPAPQLAHPEACAALRIVLVTVPRVSRSCGHFSDGFDLHLLRL